MKELLNKLKKYEDENNHKKVIETIDSIIKKHPEPNTTLLNMKINALIELKEYNKAIKYLEIYLNDCESEEKFEIYEDLALCYSKLDNTEKEEEYLIKALNEQPDNLLINKKLSFHFYLTKQYKKCIKLIEKLIENESADLADYNTLIYSYIAIDNTKKLLNTVTVLFQ